MRGWEPGCSGVIFGRKGLGYVGLAPCGRREGCPARPGEEAELGHRFGVQARAWALGSFARGRQNVWVGFQHLC